MANFELQSQPSLRFQLGCDTDIGGGRENQDESFVWIRREHNLIVLCVLDGHGREVGRVAAFAAKSSLIQLLESEYGSLMTNPVEFLIRAHQFGHSSIREAFRLELEKQGFQVKESDDGYLMKRRSHMDYWSCVHGGTSCTIVALVNNFLYISNVGDSTAILCSGRPVLNKSFLVHEVDAATCPMYGGVEDPLADDFRSFEENTDGASSKILVLSADHSPESPYEFNRLRKYRHRENDPNQPALFVVYDSSTHDKSMCNAVFDGSSIKLTASQRGSYYKNVRKEWASLVSTPKSAKYQDALAFTRSLGDLHLHTYGVTHLPEVQKLNLENVFQALANSENNSDQPVSESIESSTICVVVATDGVWDNWLYEDVSRFVFDQSCLQATINGSDGAQRIMSSFMQRNAYFSKKNFGNQADNATGILMYLSYSGSFCT